MGNGCARSCVGNRAELDAAPAVVERTRPRDRSAAVCKLLQRVDVAVLLERQELSNFAALWCDDAAARRMLVATEGDIGLAAKKMTQAMKWRDSRRHLLEGDCPLAFDLRCVGLDTSDCGIIYGCFANQTMNLGPCIDLAIAEFERTVTLLDLNGCSGQIVAVIDCVGFCFWRNFNPAPAIEFATSLDSYFAERMSQCIVVDMPRAAKFLWDAVSSVLPPKTRSKFFFGNREECLQLLANRCHNEDEKRGAQALANVRKAMMLNRLGDTTLESRRRTWNNTTWRGASVLSVGKSLPLGDEDNANEVLLRAAVARMEAARSRRAGANYETCCDGHERRISENPSRTLADAGHKPVRSGARALHVICGHGAFFGFGTLLFTALLMASPYADFVQLFSVQGGPFQDRG